MLCPKVVTPAIATGAASCPVRATVALASAESGLELAAPTATSA
jgi:hypothetical protein